MLILNFIAMLLFSVQYLVLGPLLQIFLFKTKYYYEDDSRQNKRIKEGVVFISNHRSFLDGLVIALKYFLKKFHFVSEDFFVNRLRAVKFIARTAGSIFVDSDFNSFEFIEESRKVIAKGRPVMIFPEGGFQYTYEPSKFYSGYILLAINTKSKIIPVVNDFSYGLFKRVHLLIGNTIDLSEYYDTELTWAKRKEINKEIYEKYMMLFYQLKREKAKKYFFKYETASPFKGDVIRIPAGTDYHYGIYLSDDEVIQFGCAENRLGEEITVNSVSIKEFCGEKIPEVRIIKKRFTRAVKDIEKYAKSCVGQGRYDAEKNNCLDFVNRVTLKI